MTFGHHLLAYVEMLGRDRGRLGDCRARLNESPARRGRARRHLVSDRPRHDGEGTGLRPRRRPIRSTPSPTAISRSNSSRGAAIAAMHLSRFAEEIVLWLTEPFRFVRLSDAFTTGSSIMPQKRNPDAAELVRAKAGRLLGALTGLFGGDEGPAARLCQGHAGRQGAGVRCRRHLVAVPSRDDRHGARHEARQSGDAARSPRPASAPRPIWPTGWCGIWASRSAKRIT